jgi:hypothetical protein
VCVFVQTIACGYLQWHPTTFMQWAIFMCDFTVKQGINLALWTLNFSSTSHVKHEFFMQSLLTLLMLDFYSLNIENKINSLILYSENDFCLFEWAFQLPKRLPSSKYRFFLTLFYISSPHRTVYLWKYGHDAVFNWK